MKKLLGGLLTATALTTALPVFAAEIIVVAHGQANDPFWSVVKNGVEMAAKHSGATVDYRSPETFDMVAMSQLIDAAVNQAPDGLVVSIPDADALGPSIQRAVAAGIPVISMSDVQGLAQLSVWDASGRCVRRRGWDGMPMPIEALGSGAYLVRVERELRQAQRKVIVP